MKKIISMLCVVAMMFSFVAISANAADIAVSIVENAAKATDDKLAYDIVVQNTDGITGVVIQLDFADFLTKNTDMTKTDITAEKVEATGANPVITGTNAFIASNYTDTNGAKTEVTMFTVYIAKANFKNDATFAFRSACKITALGSAANVFSSAVQTGATIKAPAPAGPTYTVIAPEVKEYVGTADPVDYAYAVLFETASSISDVIWAADGKYSNAIKLDAPVEGSVKLGFTSDSQLTNVGGLFNAGDVVYYTSNVDLDAKAE